MPACSFCTQVSLCPSPSSGVQALYDIVTAAKGVTDAPPLCTACTTAVTGKRLGRCSCWAMQEHRGCMHCCPIFPACADRRMPMPITHRATHTPGAELTRVSTPAELGDQAFKTALPALVSAIGLTGPQLEAICTPLAASLLKAAQASTLSSGAIIGGVCGAIKVRLPSQSNTEC